MKSNSEFKKTYKNGRCNSKRNRKWDRELKQIMAGVLRTRAKVEALNEIGPIERSN